MPWLSILMAVLSAIASLKAAPEKKGRAVAAAALAGIGTYYVTHETEWGRDVLGEWDGVPPAAVPGSETAADGSTTTGEGTKVPAPTTGSTTNAWDVLKGWGPTGTATVIGTTGVVTSSGWQKYVPWLLGLGALWVVTRN